MTYEEDVAEMKRDEKISGIVGCGEIIDEGRLSKEHLRKMMNDELVVFDKNEPSIFDTLFSDTAKKETDEERAERRRKIVEKYEKMIEDAPEVAEHDYHYYP